VIEDLPSDADDETRSKWEAARIALALHAEKKKLAKKEASLKAREDLLKKKEASRQRAQKAASKPKSKTKPKKSTIKKPPRRRLKQYHNVESDPDSLDASADDTLSRFLKKSTAMLDARLANIQENEDRRARGEPIIPRKVFGYEIEEENERWEIYQQSTSGIPSSIEPTIEAALARPITPPRRARRRLSQITSPTPPHIAIASSPLQIRARRAGPNRSPLPSLTRPLVRRSPRKPKRTKVIPSSQDGESEIDGFNSPGAGNGDRSSDDDLKYHMQLLRI
jgi:hypothetical protein